MHGKQCSDERLYFRREMGGKGIKSLMCSRNEGKSSMLYDVVK